MVELNQQDDNNTWASIINQQFENIKNITSEWWLSILYYIQKNSKDNENDENDEKFPVWYLDTGSVITWKQLVENSKIFIKITNINNNDEVNRPPPLLDVSIDEINKIREANLKEACRKISY
jgi:hypothetical protein